VSNKYIIVTLAKVDFGRSGFWQKWIFPIQDAECHLCDTSFRCSLLPKIASLCTELEHQEPRRQSCVQLLNKPVIQRHLQTSKYRNSCMGQSLEGIIVVFSCGGHVHEDKTKEELMVIEEPSPTPPLYHEPIATVM